MNVLKKIIKWLCVILLSLLALFFGYGFLVGYLHDTENLPANHGKVNSELFLGSGQQQLLVVGLGGSEGGNAWASDYWKPTRQALNDKGYALLAVAYFGEQGVSAELDRVEISAVHAAIKQAQKNPQINANCSAIIGGSKGAELALLLASEYSDVQSVVSIVGASVAFPALTQAMNTSSWTLHDKPIEYIPMTWGASLPLLLADIRGSFYVMMQDKQAMKKSAIAVEKIDGSVLLVSATQDEMWPSTKMSEQVMQRLEKNNFTHAAQHIAIEGNHAEPLKHFDKIIAFLEANYKDQQNSGCQNGG